MTSATVFLTFIADLLPSLIVVSLSDHNLNHDCQELDYFPNLWLGVLWNCTEPIDAVFRLNLLYLKHLKLLS